MNQATQEVTLSEVVNIPYHCLRRTSDNMRTVNPSQEDDQKLIANIRATGAVLQNLVVTPLDDEEGCYGVNAGGRRFGAVGVLVKDGVFPEDFPVPCRVQTGGSRSAVSVAENLKAAVHPADEFNAFKKMRNDGMDVATIANHYGISEFQVHQRLKLAQVAPMILNAYRRGDIELDTVMAFTLAENQKAQTALFKDLGGRCSAWQVKRALTNETIRSDDRLVKYIGLDAYKDAGGKVLADMFEDYDHICDFELVEQLAGEKLAKAAERIRKREGWGDVFTTLERHFHVYDAYVLMQPDSVNVPDELNEKIASLNTERDRICDEDDWSEESEDQLVKIDDELEAAEKERDGYRAFTEDQKNAGVLVATINHSGKVEYDRGLMTKAAARAAKSKDNKTSGGEEAASTATLPQALLTDLGAHRQQIARLTMLSNPSLAEDILLFALVQNVIGDYWNDKGINLRAESNDPMDERFRETDAAAAWDKAKSKLYLEFQSADGEAAQFAALRELTPKRKQGLLTFCVAACFETGLMREEESLNELIIETMAPDYAEHFRPTDAEYFKRLKRDDLVALGEALFGAAFEERKKWKKGQLVTFFHDFFNKPLPSDLDGEIRAKYESIRAHWLPDGFLNPVA